MSRRGQGPKAKTKFSLTAALAYAAEHASGCNPDAHVSRTENVEGAARLCAWALAREVRGTGGRMISQDAFVDWFTRRLHTKLDQLRLFDGVRVDMAVTASVDSALDHRWHSPIEILSPKILCSRCKIRVRSDAATGLCRVCGET